jgi:hypothetical protein
MKLLMHAKFSPQAFNEALRKGNLASKIRDILGDAKPDFAYFTEFDGRRGVLMLIDLNDPSEVPKFAEPWFLTFDADVQFHVAMTPEDLGKGDLEALAKKWA